MRDLPKYEVLITDNSYKQWEKFMENVATDLSTINPTVEWVLSMLQEAANGRRPPNTLSEETRMLLEKESRVPKKV